MGVYWQPGREPLNLQLWFGTVLVADLLDVFPHQGTWYARYRPLVAPEQGPRHKRLYHYIRFCENWHGRLDRGQNPDPAEFDRFADVLMSDQWRIPCPEGTELPVTEGPIFAAGQASWNHPESEPSREQAAGELWSRLTGQRGAAEPGPAADRPRE
jgi:hypothetical protein